MKKSISVLLAILMLLAAFTALIPAASAADPEYFFDFERCTANAPYTAGQGLSVSGYFNLVLDDPHSKGIYIANGRASGSNPIAPTVLTLNTGYIDKVMQFDFTYSGTFGQIGGLYISIYQNNGTNVYSIISPVWPHQWKDSTSSDTVLGTTDETFDAALWYTAKFVMSGQGIYSKVWEYGENEPSGWNCIGSTNINLVAAGSQVAISIDGTNDGSGIGSLIDNLKVAPLDDEERAKLPALPQKYTVDVHTADSKMGTVLGSAVVLEGNEVTVRAIEKTGYSFVSWTDESGAVISTDPEFSFIPMEDTKLTANFDKASAKIRSFMAEGLTTVADIDEANKTVALRFASDVDLANVYPYFYLDAGIEVPEACYARMDLSSGRATVGTGGSQWTITATKNKEMKRFYVNGKTGSDENDGLSAATAFATLGKAKAAVAAIKTWDGDVVVSIAAGEYILTETLEFTEAESAPRGYAVIWQGETGNPNDVVISSGRHLAGNWKKTYDVYTTDNQLAWEYDATDIPYSRDLYINGKVAQIAKMVLDDGTSGSWDMADISEMKLNSSFGYTTSGELAEMYTWRNPSDIEFAYEVGWTYDILPVESISESGSGSKVVMVYRPFQSALRKSGVQITDPNFILNCYEALDEIGEWYFDREAGKIYYISALDENPNNMDIVMPTLDQLITIDGDGANRFYGFTLKDIKFEYTSYLRPHTYGQAEIQACYLQDQAALDWEYFHQHDSFLKTDGGITVAYAECARVAHCIFTNMSASAFDYEIGCRGCQFVRNTIQNVGANGLSVGGVSVRDAQPYSTHAYIEGILVDGVEPDPERVTQFTYVFSNYLDGIGLLYKGAVGIFAGHVADITIAHNTITNASYSGISIGWGWGAWDGLGNSAITGYYTFPDTPSIQARYVVENNDISNVCQRLADGGTVYILSLMPGSKLNGNLMHDSPIKWGGIYFDCGGAGFSEIKNNITYNCFQDYFFHTTYAYYNQRQADTDALVRNGMNFLGRKPEDAVNNKVYQTITANAGILDAQKPEGVHTYGEWEVVTPATKETAGLEQRVCADCGEIETREIPCLGGEDQKSGCKSVIVSGLGLLIVASFAGAACVFKRKEK